MDGLFTLLLYAAFFYFMMRFGCGAHMTHGHHHKKEKDVDVFLDPVCGKEVADDEGYGELVNGHLYRFCSKSCLDEFDQHKQEYSKKPNKFKKNKEHHHEA